VGRHGLHRLMVTVTNWQLSDFERLTAFSFMAVVFTPSGGWNPPRHEVDWYLTAGGGLSARAAHNRIDSADD
jgi:hypothetical protein